MMSSVDVIAVETLLASAWRELLGEEPEKRQVWENAGKAFSFHSLVTDLRQRYGLLTGDGVAWRLGRSFYRQWIRQHPDAEALRGLAFRLLPPDERKEYTLNCFFQSVGYNVHIEVLPDAAWLLQLDAPAEGAFFWIGVVDAMLSALSGDKIWNIQLARSSDAQKVFLLIPASPFS